MSVLFWLVGTKRFVLDSVYVTGCVSVRSAFAVSGWGKELISANGAYRK